MSEHILKNHNKTVLLYHLVFPAKYRRKIFTKEIEKTLVEICIEISQRYEINFMEIGNDEDHVHFLVQGVPKMPVSRIVQIIKSITARELFSKHPEIKKVLWGGNLWTSGFYANTVGQKDFILVNGCENIQGYFYSRPIPADELEKLLRNGF